jgi:DNA-binding MarR family transcriptional regulator
MRLLESHIQLLRTLAQKLRVQAPPLADGCEELERAGYVKVVAPQTGTDLTILVVEITDAGRRALKKVDDR